MRDVEAKNMVALMEFMYAGEVNVAQAHLSTFLKTAESLRIRGLTDTPTEKQTLKSSSISTNNKNKSVKHQISSSSTVTSSQDITNRGLSSPPPLKRQKSDFRQNKEDTIKDDSVALKTTQPKLETPDYLSEEEDREDDSPNFYTPEDITELPG